MKLSVFLMVGLAVCACSGLPSAADPVPERVTGIWSTTECAADGLMLLVNSRIALMIAGKRPEIRIAVVPVAWAGESFILRLKGETGAWSLPLADLERCDALPGALSPLFADLVAVFSKTGDILALCRSMDDLTTPCVTAVADLIDDTGDGTFSRAELRQAMRTASFFIAYHGVAARQREAFVSLEQLLIARLAASVAGPVVVAHLIDSYDADGDDAVSPHELLQGREPEQAVQGILANLIAKTPPPVAAVLRNTMLGVQPSP